MLKDLYNKLLDVDFDAIFINVVNSKIVLDSINSLNIIQIYDKGILSDNSKIRRLGENYSDYSVSYKNYKIELGRYQGYVDLSLSGVFLETLNVTYQEHKILIEFGGYQVDGGNLADILRASYSNKIEGLTEENFNKLCNEIILPNLQSAYYEALKRAFYAAK